MKGRPDINQALRSKLQSMYAFPHGADSFHIPTKGRFPVRKDPRNATLAPFPDRLPPGIGPESVSDLLRYPTADIRKMWPALSREFNFTGQRPLGDAIPAFMRQLFATPFGGRAFMECALEAKVARKILFLERTPTGIGLLKDLLNGLGEQIAPAMIGNALIANAWIFGELPDPSQYNEIYQRAYIESQPPQFPLGGPYPANLLGEVLSYLDWLRSLSPAEESTPDTEPTCSGPTPQTVELDSKKLFATLAGRLRDALDKADLKSEPKVFDVMAEAVAHLREVSRCCQLLDGILPPGNINPLLASVHSSVEQSNKATHPQFCIQPLPVTEAPEGAPYLTYTLRSALESAIKSAAEIPRHVDELAAVKSALLADGGMGSDDDLARMGRARTSLLAAAAVFGTEVDQCRVLFDVANSSVAVNADAIKAGQASILKATMFATGDEPESTECARLVVVDVAAPAPQPKHYLTEVSPVETGLGQSDAAPTVAAPAAATSVPAPSAPVPASEPAPIQQAPTEIPSWLAPPAATEIPAQEVAVNELADPVVEAHVIPATSDDGLTLRSVRKMMLNGNPGLALALARIHEEALLDELIGGPAFYALLAGAASTCGVDTPRYDGLDRHFDAVMQRLQSAADETMGQAYAMAYLAAVVKPALLTPNSQAAYNIHLLTGWLGVPALESLAPLFEEPIRTNLPVSIDSLRDASGKGEDARRTSLAQARIRARQMIDNVEGTTRHDFNSHGFSQTTWRFIRSAAHPLGGALHALANNETGPALADKLQTAIAAMEEGVDDVIDAAFSKYSNDRLISVNRLRMFTAVERIGEFIEQAKGLVNPPPVRRADEAARLANYTSRLVSGLASSIDALDSVSYEGAHEIARGVLLMILKDLKELVVGGAAIRPSIGIDERLLRDLVLQDVEIGIEINGGGNEGTTLYAVGREAVLHGNRNDLLTLLRQAEPVAHSGDAFVAAARRHVAAERILSANAAITAVRAQTPDHSDLSDLVTEYEAARYEARLKLRDRALGARKALSRAAFSSLLPPADVARKEAAIDAVLDLSKTLPIEGPVSGPIQNDRPTDFIMARQFLDVTIVEPLAQMQRKAVTAFEEKVAAERDKVPEANQPAVDKVLQLARDGQIVSAEEFWAQLLSGQDLPRLESGNVVLREFHEQYVPTMSRQDKMPPAETAGISKDDLQLRRALLDSWLQVCQPGQTGGVRSLTAFLAALVRTDVAAVGSPQVHGSVAVHEVAGLDFTRAVGSEAFVLPVIGSISKTRFRVAVVHGSGSLTHIREGLTHGPNLLLTRAKLTIDDRRKLYADIRKDGRGCLIIDEHLVQFAAQAPASAAARVVAVASTFLYTEPYKVEDATTPEMFFGRRAARRQIFEARTALIFGGRRLGKSTIIADICRKETSPAQKKFYVHVELNQFMEAEKYEEEVWRRIAQALSGMGVVSNPGIQFNVGNPKAVLETLKKGFQEDKITHLTIYLDEADRFMKLEESTNFRVLYELSNELAHRFPDRFSYAISGLNNVQRISLGWNSRLGRIGDPIAITPFINEDRHEGLRLIVEPLAALGFEFESPDLPLQILSAASFYPALIQGYCSKLLDSLYKKPALGVAPFKITLNDLVTTEASDELRLKFLNIFKVTVLLDTRYMAVCAILAEEQEFRDGADVSMLLSAISERAVQVAPDLFPKSDPTTIVEAACEALINLGLLVRQPHTQQYQFRSPRILSKVREITQVADFLRGVGNRQTFVDHDPAEHRPLFTDRSICPLPERLVNTVCAPSMPGESIRFITGSEASGLLRLRNLVNDPVWAGGRVVAKNGLAESEQLLGDFINQLSRNRDATRQKLTLHRAPQQRELYVVCGNWVPTTPDRIAAVDKALQDEHRSVLLVCDPERAWDLSSQPGTRMTYLPLWTPAALRLHLQRLELPDFTGDEPLNQMLEVSGGCSTLIEAGCHWLADKRRIPSTIELLKAIKVSDLKAVYGLFGLRQGHEAILNDMPSRPDTRQALEQFFRTKGIESDATRLLTYMEWMGALQVDEQGRWGLNPVITTAMLEMS